MLLTDIVKSKFKTQHTFILTASTVAKNGIVKRRISSSVSYR